MPVRLSHAAGAAAGGEDFVIRAATSLLAEGKFWA